MTETLELQKVKILKNELTEYSEKIKLKELIYFISEDLNLPMNKVKHYLNKLN
jgi:predicted solute-binding protein